MRHLLGSTVGRSRPAVLAVASALALGVLAAAPAQARWTAPHRISDRVQVNRWQQAAGDGRGAVLVAWDRTPSDPYAPLTVSVVLRHRDRSGHWNVRHRVSPAMTGGGGVAGVAMNGRGQGVVVYAVPLSSGETRLVERRVHASGRVDPPRRIAEGSSVGLSSVALDGAGDVVVVWTHGNQDWQVTVFQKGGARTPAVPVPTGAVSVYSPPRLATNSRRGIALAWTDYSQVHTVRVSAAGRLGPDVVVNDPAEVGTPLSADVHLTDAGTVALSWYTWGVSDTRGYVAWRRPDGSVVRRRVTGPDVDVSSLQATADDRGRLVVLWLDQAPAAPYPGSAHLRRVTPGGPLGSVHTLTVQTLGVTMTGRPDGTGVVWWRPVRGTVTGRAVRYSARGRLGVVRRAPEPTNPASIVPVEHDHYLALTLHNDANDAVELEAQIGP